MTVGGTASHGRCWEMRIGYRNVGEQRKLRDELEEWRSNQRQNFTFYSSDPGKPRIELRLVMENP